MFVRRITRVALASGTAVVGAGALLVLPLSGSAGASGPLTTSSVSITCSTGTCVPGPYQDQQIINISAPPNTTFLSGDTIQILECADPGGLVANLPSTAAGHCDGLTINQDGLQTNADGSFSESVSSGGGYTVYELPSASLLENHNGLPKCDLANPCALYIGDNYNSIPASNHVWSAPFSVGTAAQGVTSPGDGTPEAPLMIGLPLVAAGVVGGFLFLRRRRSTGVTA